MNHHGANFSQTVRARGTIHSLLNRRAKRADTHTHKSIIVNSKWLSPNLSWVMYNTKLFCLYVKLAKPTKVIDNLIRTDTLNADRKKKQLHCCLLVRNGLSSEAIIVALCTGVFSQENSWPRNPNSTHHWHSTHDGRTTSPESLCTRSKCREKYAV